MKINFKHLSTLFFASTLMLACISCTSNEDEDEDEPNKKQDSLIIDSNLLAIWSPADQPTGSSNNIYMLNFMYENQGTLLAFNNNSTTEYHSFIYSTNNKKQVTISFNMTGQPTQQFVYSYAIDGDTLTLQNRNDRQRFVRGKHNPILGSWKSIESQKGKVKYEDLEYSTYKFYISGPEEKSYVTCEFRNKDIIDVKTNKPCLNKESHEWESLNLSQLFIKNYMNEGKIFNVRFYYKANEGKLYLELSDDSFKNTYIRFEKTEEDTGEGGNMLSLLQEKDHANIFTPVKYSLNGRFTGTDVYAYDSIVWHIDGIKGRFYVMNKDKKPSNFTISWTYYFYNPGKYITHLDFYKDGKSIKRNSSNIIINDSRDFLDVNWNSTEYDNQVRANVLDFEHEMGITIGSISNSKYALLWLNRNIEFNSTQTQQDKNYFNSYMTNLFSTPLNFAPESADIQKEYEQLFKYRYNSDGKSMKIYKIWKTIKSKIALVSLKDKNGERCAVIAEPIA